MQTAGYTHQQSNAFRHFGDSVLPDTELVATIGGVEVGRQVTLADYDEFGRITDSESVLFTDDGHTLSVIEPLTFDGLDALDELVGPFVPDEFLL